MTALGTSPRRDHRSDLGGFIGLAISARWVVLQERALAQRDDEGPGRH